MKSDNTVREILLMYNTRFLLRNWLAQKDDFEEKYSAAADQLKVACWNGLVPEILPECFETSFSQQQYLWDVIECRAFIGLNYSNSLPMKEERLSVDPHIFIRLQNFN